MHLIGGQCHCALFSEGPILGDATLTHKTYVPTKMVSVAQWPRTLPLMTNAHKFEQNKSTDKHFSA